MDEVGVANTFWGEFAHTTVYLANKILLRPNSDKIPHELWKGKLARLDYLKVFGRKCYIKRNDYNLGMFDS